MPKWWLALAAIPAVAAAYPSGPATPLAIDMPAVPAHAEREFSVLTYNVQDLPWPLAGDRETSFEAMRDRLAALRDRGAAPQIVVLQEAFSPSAVAMLRAAGYPHIVSGPGAEQIRPVSPVPLDPDFLANRSKILGEAQPAQLSSGLVIASDYPIESTVAEVFPAGVCAGIDCLANKGAMLVRVRMPGIERPVEIVTTHLNSGRKSRTPAEHNLYAYRQQLAALGRFVTARSDPGAIRLIAGDVNVSHSAARLDALTMLAARLNLTPVAAMGKPAYEADCRAPRADCKGSLKLPANVPMIHTLDWHFASADARNALRPLSRHTLFGVERDGTMLSDHIGYAVRYHIDG